MKTFTTMNCIEDRQALKQCKDTENFYQEMIEHQFRFMIHVHFGCSGELDFWVLKIHI